MEKGYKIYCIVDSIVRNDRYVAEYDGIVYETEEEAKKVIQAEKRNVEFFIREV